MNLFLQEGTCISPPFPRQESVCLSLNRSTVEDGYYHEMHNFEYINYAKVNSVSDMKSEYNKRNERLRNCSHIWDKEEMKIIMKPREAMVKSGGWA